MPVIHRLTFAFCGVWQLRELEAQQAGGLDSPAAEAATSTEAGDGGTGAGKLANCSSSCDVVIGSAAATAATTTSELPLPDEGDLDWEVVAGDEAVDDAPVCGEAPAASVQNIGLGDSWVVAGTSGKGE